MRFFCSEPCTFSSRYREPSQSCHTLSYRLLAGSPGDPEHLARGAFDLEAAEPVSLHDRGPARRLRVDDPASQPRLPSAAHGALPPEDVPREEDGRQRRGQRHRRGTGT